MTMQSFVHSAKISDTSPDSEMPVRNNCHSFFSSVSYISGENYAMLTIVGLLAKNALCLALNLCAVPIFYLVCGLIAVGLVVLS